MAELSLLGIVQEFCGRVSQPVPGVVAGTTDDGTLQIWKLMNEGIQDIGQRFDMTELQTYVQFTHAGGLNYLAADLTDDTLFPGFKFMIDRTFWNNTTRLQMEDPVEAVDWQAIVNLNITRALYAWRKFGRGLYIYPLPAPLGSVTFSFYYQSKYGVQSAAGIPQLAYLLDTDTPRLQSELILADIKWRWKREKGFPYAEDLRTFEGQLVNMVGRQPMASISLDDNSAQLGMFPALFIPAGSWPHP